MFFDPDSPPISFPRNLRRPSGRKTAVLTAVSTSLLVGYVATLSIAAGMVGLAVAGALAAVAARRRGRRPLRRLARWAARVGVEVLGNLPAPQRPR